MVLKVVLVGTLQSSLIVYLHIGLSMVVTSRTRTCDTSGDPRQQGCVVQSNGDKCQGPVGILGIHKSQI
jgi:hypothetical protein